jgi:hypothetical protein
VVDDAGDLSLELLQAGSVLATFRTALASQGP